MVMIGTALSRIMGYVRIFVFAYVFGSTGLADVLTAVISIPESFRNLFAEGALSSAFIPTLSTSLVEDPTGRRARRIVSNLFAFVLLVLVPLCSLGVIFNRQVVGAFVHFNDTRLFIAASADGSRLAAAADDGAFHVSVDGGETWTETRSEHKWESFALSADGTRALGAVKDGYLYFSADEGESWDPLMIAGRREWSAVGLSGDGRIGAAGTGDGLLLISRDGGETWSDTAAGGGRSVTAVSVSPDGKIILVGTDDGILEASRDSGISWTAGPVKKGRNWVWLSLAADGTTALGAGSDGYLYLSVNGGDFWTTLRGAGRRAWSSASITADGNSLFAAVSEGTFYRSRDRGATWTEEKGAGTYRWKMGLAEKLFPYDVWFLLLISLSAVLMGALNAKHKFTIPAFTPILFSVTVIASILWLPLPIEYRMIAGIVSGGAVQVLFQLPSFLRARYRPVPDFRLRNRDFGRILFQWLPVVLSASIFVINNIVARLFASTLEAGSITALYNATTFFQLPLGIFAIAIITVLFPRFSRQAALSDLGGLKETLRYGLRFMLVLLVPATLLLVFLGEDVIGLALQHGAYTRAGTLQTAPVLSAFALGLFPTGALYLFQRLHYALKDYWRPLATAGVILALDVGLSLVLKETPLRVAGLALASTLSFGVGLVLFVFMTRKRLGALGLRGLATSGLKTLVGNIPLAGIVVAYFILVRPAVAGFAFIPRLAVLLGVGLGAAGITFAMYLVLKVDIVEDILKGRLKRRA
ncbi:MAG: murein biosynthesis integral membrane protein MurJ [Spirochaetales bacterium]|nr:murein biosynthesis integral membrane protein MurJ [Spirochaetales bacterium]